jgi:predicted Zn-dependent peptidase
MLHHTLRTLPSGLTIISVPMPAVESITVLALVNAGSRYEKAEWLGISHFLEHMVFKGTDQYPDAQSLSAAVDAVGAKFNAFTSKEYTGYYVKSASKHLELALDVVSDMLLTPKLRQADIDREKGVIIEEINMYADMPSSHIANQFEQMMFKFATIGHDVIGTKETVSALTTDDFQEYLNSWYGMKNITLILAGDDKVLKKSSTMSLVKKAFSKGNAAQRKAEKAKDHFGTNPITKKKMHIENRPTEQAHFILGFPGFSRLNPRRHALSILGVILGGNMSSRLFSEVREKRGLCYYIHSETDFYHDTGVFGASAGVDPKRVDEAVKVTLGEFAALKDGTKPITKDELQKAKDYISGKFVLDLEDSESVAQYFGMKQLLLGEIETPEELLKQFMSVTLEDINAVIQKVIVLDEARFAIIGPFKDSKRFAKLLTAA